MKVKIMAVLNAFDGVSALLNVGMPPRAAYWVSRLMKKIEPEYNLIVQQRNKIISKHANEDDPQKVASENMEAYQAEIRPLLEEEIEVDIPVVKIDVFEKVNITPAILLALGPFLE